MPKFFSWLSGQVPPLLLWPSGKVIASWFPVPAESRRWLFFFHSLFSRIHVTAVLCSVCAAAATASSRTPWPTACFFKKNSRVTRLKENNNRSFSIFYHLRCASAIISFPFQIFSFYVLLCIEVLLTTCFFKNRTKRISRIVLRSCVMNLCIKYCTWRILPDKDNII